MSIKRREMPLKEINFQVVKQRITSVGKRKLDEKWLKPYSEWTPEMQKEFPLPKPIIIVFIPED